MIALRNLRPLLICASIAVPAWFASVGQATSPTVDKPSLQLTIDVMVSDKNGKPVSGLEKQDFTLLDDKQPQNITSFQAIPQSAATMDPPAKAVMVLDTVNTSFVTMSREKQELENFFLQNGGRLPLPVSLAIFSYSGLNMQPTTSNDGKVELQFLDQNPIAVHSDNRAQGAPGAYERIDSSLAALRRVTAANLHAPGRTLIVWISPGWPIPPEPAVGLGPKEKEGVFDRIVALSGLMLLARTTLYSVDPLGTDDAGGFSTNRYKEYLNEIKTASQPQVANLALQVFAIHSGGRVLVGSNDLVGELNSCLDDGATYYELSFVAPPADHINEYHHLEVKIDKPDLKARTRAGYYIQP